MLPKGRAELLFAAAGLALIASQVWLRALTNGLDEHQASSLSQVMPLILGLAVPTGLLLAAGPRLVAIAPSRFVWLALLRPVAARRRAAVRWVPPARG